MKGIEERSEAKEQVLTEAPPLQEAPTGSIERRRVVDPIGSVGNSDPEPTPPDTPVSFVPMAGAVRKLWVRSPPCSMPAGLPIP